VFDAVRIGALLWANRKPPKVMPAKKTAVIAKIITPLFRGAG
jgi:hypothetical protein